MSNDIMSSSDIGLGEIRTTSIRDSWRRLPINDDNYGKRREGYRANLLPSDEIFPLRKSIEADTASTFKKLDCPVF